MYLASGIKCKGLPNNKVAGGTCDYTELREHSAIRESLLLILFYSMCVSLCFVLYYIQILFMFWNL